MERNIYNFIILQQWASICNKWTSRRTKYAKLQRARLENMCTPLDFTFQLQFTELILSLVNSQRGRAWDSEVCFGSKWSVWTQSYGSVQDGNKSVDLLTK